MITKADANNLRLQLERRGGAHSHTAGKAGFYLGRLADKPNAKFSNCTVDHFVSAVQAAITDDKWRELSDLMARWW